jgi:hypothetical protein
MIRGRGSERRGWLKLYLLLSSVASWCRAEEVLVAAAAGGEGKGLGFWRGVRVWSMVWGRTYRRKLGLVFDHGRSCKNGESDG